MSLSTTLPVQTPLLAHSRKQYEKLMQELPEILQQTGTLVQRLEQCHDLCLQALHTLMDEQSRQTWSEPVEIIDFFKNIKPGFHAQVIYYQHRLQLEVNRPPGEATQMKEFLHRALQKTTDFFTENKFIYQYLRSGQSHLDEALFGHQEPDTAIGMRLYSLMDEPAFPTRFDGLVAQVKANDLLAQYLQEALLDQQAGPISQHPSLQWTASKVGAVELIYALYASKVINEGQADLKDIVDAFQHIFQINLGNYARVMQEILYRKSGNAVFVDHIKNELLRYIQRIEDRRVR